MHTNPDNPIPAPETLPRDLQSEHTGAPVPLTPTRHDRLKHLFEAHYQPLLQFAASLGSRELADAEDAVHDTFLVLATTRAELLDDQADLAEVDRRLRTYLYGSVRGRMLNVARRYTARIRQDARIEPPAVSHPLRQPDDHLEAAEEAQHLRACYEAWLDLLSPQQRAVIVGLYEEGYTYDQIAHHLGISAGAAKRHAARAFQKIRAATISTRRQR